MAFNSNTYRMNKYRREAWVQLEAARDIKARVARDEAYKWELPRIKFFADQARISMHLYLSCRAIRNLSRGAS